MDEMWERELDARRQRRYEAEMDGVIWMLVARHLWRFAPRYGALALAVGLGWHAFPSKSGFDHRNLRMFP